MTRPSNSHQHTTTMSTNGDSPEPSGADASRDPSGFLSEIIGAPVTVKLNSGIVYKGIDPFPVTVFTPPSSVPQSGMVLGS